MKKHLLLLPVLLLIIGLLFFWEPERPREVIRGTVVDRAMDDGLPYIGIQPDVGDGLCIYCRSGKILPDPLSVGDRVEVRYETVPFLSDVRHFAVSVIVLE